MCNIIEHTIFVYFSWRYLAINREHSQLKIHYPHLKSSVLRSDNCFHDAWKFSSLWKLPQINNMLSSMMANHYTICLWNNTSLKSTTFRLQAAALLPRCTAFLFNWKCRESTYCQIRQCSKQSSWQLHLSMSTYQVFLLDTSMGQIQWPQSQSNLQL